MKKIILFLFSLCTLCIKAQIPVSSYGPEGKILVDSTYIEPLYPLTSEEKSKATELIHSMEVSTQSGNAYTIKAFKIKDWEEGDFQYVEIYKDKKKIYEMSNGNSFIHFPKEYIEDSSPKCCYVAHMGEDAVALVFHEMTYGSNLPNMTIVVLKDNQATLVYNKECSIMELKHQTTEISFEEYIPGCYTMDNTPCIDNKKLFISKDGIKISAKRTLQDDLRNILKYDYKFTPLPYNETKCTSNEFSYGIDNTSGQIPNRLYQNLQCTEYFLADENELLPAAHAKFRTSNPDISLIAVNFGGATEHITSVLVSVNKNGELLDTLEVEAGWIPLYVKQYRILANGKIVVTSIKPKQKESIPFHHFGSFVGNRIDCTYRVEDGKFILEKEQVFDEQTYTEELLKKSDFNLWYDNILEHEKFTLQEAKDTFQKRKERYLISNKYYTGIGLPAGEFTPEWDEAIASVHPSRDYLLCYSVPIETQYHYKAILLNSFELEHVNVYQKMIIMKNSLDGHINFYLLTLVPDKDYEKRNKHQVASNYIHLKEDNYFSGVTIFSSLFTGLITSADKFKNGRFVKGIFLPSKEDEIMERMVDLISILQPYHFFLFAQLKAKSVEFDWERIKQLNTRNQ